MKIFHAPRYLLLTSLVLLGIGSSVHAEDPLSVSVRVEAKPEPVRAVGLVFSSTSSHEISDTKITKIGDKLYDIDFTVPRNIVRQDSVASAVAYDESGQPTYSNVTPALLSQTRAILASIPECPAADTTKVALLNSPGSLQQLVDLRTERVAIARYRIAEALDSTFLAKLRRFEEVLGLSRPTELSAELPAQELIDRLSRIDLAFKRYQAEKGQSSSK